MLGSVEEMEPRPSVRPTHYAHASERASRSAMITTMTSHLPIRLTDKTKRPFNSTTAATCPHCHPLPCPAQHRVSRPPQSCQPA